MFSLCALCRFQFSVFSFQYSLLSFLFGCFLFSAWLFSVCCFLQSALLCIYVCQTCPNFYKTSLMVSPNCWYFTIQSVSGMMDATKYTYSSIELWNISLVQKFKTQHLILDTTFNLRHNTSKNCIFHVFVLFLSQLNYKIPKIQFGKRCHNLYIISWIHQVDVDPRMLKHQLMSIWSS